MPKQRVHDRVVQRQAVPKSGHFDNEELSREMAPPPMSLTSAADSPPPTENNTGLPDNLKSGLESLSGYSMDDVKVHYNSDQPMQLQALATAQGSDIHLGKGQEKHLPHEAWHVVQQKQGRVRPTTDVGGKAINDDHSLESEADRMGAEAMRMGGSGGKGALQRTPADPGNPAQLMASSLNEQTQLKEATADPNAPIQRMIGFEFQTAMTPTGFYKDKESADAGEKPNLNQHKMEYFQGQGFTVEGDEGELELVTDPFPETEDGMTQVMTTLQAMVTFATAVTGQVMPLEELGRQFGFSQIKKGPEGAHFKGASPIQADPQVTAGISMSKIYEMGELLANAQTRKKLPKEGASQEEAGSQDLSQMNKQELADTAGFKAFQHKIFQKEVIGKAQETVAANFGDYSPELKSFLFMVGQYILGGQQKPYKGLDNPLYAKFTLPMMSRTNIADLFQLLPESDKAIFAQQKDQLAGAFLGEGASGTQGLFPAEMGVGEDENHFGENLRSNFSIDTWLDKMVPSENGEAGTDLSAQYESLGDISNQSFHQMDLADQNIDDRKQYLAKKEGNREKYLKHLDSSTDIGEGQQGAIIEFRKLGAKLQPQEWLKFAEAVFRLVVMVNKGEDKALLEGNEPTEDRTPTQD